MNLNNFSSFELIELASSLAIFIGNNFPPDYIPTLSIFFTALADNLAILGIDNDSSKK